jgi:hypothetical protein|nr:MAG TPA: hypothetical protein [Bacteriophage sp.]
MIYIKTSTASSSIISDPRNFCIGKWTEPIHRMPSVNYSLIFNCESKISVGGITLPVYCKGIYITAGGEDACFIAVDGNAKVYVGYSNIDSWKCRTL